MQNIEKFDRISSHKSLFVCFFFCPHEKVRIFNLSGKYQADKLVPCSSSKEGQNLPLNENSVMKSV
jgi:hypothetical protein